MACSAERGTGNCWAESPALPSAGGGGGQDFTLKQCFVNNVHKADALYPAPRLQKKNPNQWSSPVQQVLLLSGVCEE